MASKKIINYVDLDGNPAEAEYWFSLDETDLLEMDFAHEKDPIGYMKEVLKNSDTRELLRFWKQMIFTSVGVRDGNRIVKGEQVVDEFRGTGAYNAFFTSLIETEDGGAEFFASIMPEKYRQKAKESMNKPTYSDAELLDMSDEDFYRAAGTTDVSKMDKRFLLLATRRKTAA